MRFQNVHKSEDSIYKCRNEFNCYRIYQHQQKMFILSFYLASKIACFRQILDYIEIGTYKKIMTVIHGGVQSQFIMNYVI